MNTYAFLLICIVFIVCGIRMAQTGSGNFHNRPGHKPSPAQQRRYRIIGMLMAAGAGTLGFLALLSLLRIG